MSVKLFYFHDPMCSWCWGFAPTWQRLRKRLNNTFNNQLSVEYIVGGLAPDSDQPMPQEMQDTLQGYWRRIENLLGAEFNHDFWTHCQPRRSTYPACRAVIAARKQNHEISMIRAIQEAYYLRAMNPSDNSTLLQLAGEIQLNTKQFAEDLTSEETEQQLQHEIAQYRQLSSRGFPSLVLQVGSDYIPIPVDYQHADTMFDTIVNYTKPRTT